MIESEQESALVAVLEQVMHHHLTQAQRGLLPAALSPHKLKQVLDINCRMGYRCRTIVSRGTRDRVRWR